MYLMHINLIYCIYLFKSILYSIHITYKHITYIGQHFWWGTYL